jgi:hypothetical protein
MLMRRVQKHCRAVLGLSLVIGLSVGIALMAQEGRPTAQPEHGGAVAATSRYQFEVVFRPDGFLVYPRGAGNTPIDVARLSGTASFQLPGVAQPFVYALRSGVTGTGQAPTSIGLAVDLSRVPASGATVRFQIDGLPDPAEPSATFTEPFVRKLAPVAAPAPGPARRPAVATISITRATAADQPAIKAQRVCPVSGESLGSMGVPIKVTRGGRAVFLCCQGCVKTVQANPDRFLGAL